MNDSAAPVVAIVPTMGMKLRKISTDFPLQRDMRWPYMSVPVGAILKVILVRSNLVLLRQPEYEMGQAPLELPPEFFDTSRFEVIR